MCAVMRDRLDRPNHHLVSLIRLGPSIVHPHDTKISNRAFVVSRIDLKTSCLIPETLQVAHFSVYHKEQKQIPLHQVMHEFFQTESHHTHKDLPSLL